MHYKQLTEQERYQIYIMKKAGHPQNAMAKLLKRAPSTISRELQRNAGLRGYRPAQAQHQALCRRHEGHKACKVTDAVQEWITMLLRQELSPQQVVDYLRRHKHVSLHHETVYRLIYADQATGGNLYRHLRIVSKPYRRRHARHERRGKIPGRVGIEQRPVVVERRQRIGDWEGDTVLGHRRQSALLTLVERKTLYTVIARLTGKRADLLAVAAIQRMKPLQAKVRTITFDNGLEFAHHATIARQLKANIYFAHPYASWERGSNENTNGLIRQYFPKGTDFNKVSDEALNRVMERLNNRPRKSRGCKSPNELFLGQRVDLLAA